MEQESMNAPLLPFLYIPTDDDDADDVLPDGYIPTWSTLPICHVYHKIYDVYEIHDTPPPLPRVAHRAKSPGSNPMHVTTTVGVSARPLGVQRIPVLFPNGFIPVTLTATNTATTNHTKG
jgi:hypothetical protein